MSYEKFAKMFSCCWPI